MPFCGIFFLWFMGAVRARIGESEDKFLSTVFLGSGVLLLFASSSIPWLQLVFPVWVLLVSINIVILSYRNADSPQKRRTVTNP